MVSKKKHKRRKRSAHSQTHSYMRTKRIGKKIMTGGMLGGKDLGWS